MKDCENYITFLGKCKDRPDGECVFLANEGVNGGKIHLDLIVDVYRRFPSDILRRVAGSFKPGRIMGETCKAAPYVTQAISQVLNERGEPLV